MAPKSESFEFVGRASHCSSGLPAAEMSAKVMPEVVRPHGKQMPCDCTTKPTKAAIATRPCLISAWRRKPIVASCVWPQNSISARLVGFQ